MRKWVCCSLVIFVSALASAQQGFVKVNEDAKIKELVEKRLELHKLKPTISGYRVQIYFGSQRAQANEVRSQFSILHPDIETYLIYQQPYFKVRVGDFRTRLEAYKLYRQIQKEYSSVFIVEDEINLPKLKGE